MYLAGIIKVMTLLVNCSIYEMPVILMNHYDSILGNEVNGCAYESVSSYTIS